MGCGRQAWAFGVHGCPSGCPLSAVKDENVDISTTKLSIVLYAHLL